MSISLARIVYGRKGRPKRRNYVRYIFQSFSPRLFYAVRGATYTRVPGASTRIPVPDTIRCSKSIFVDYTFHFPLEPEKLSTIIAYDKCPRHLYV